MPPTDPSVEFVEDSLSALNGNHSLGDQLRAIHLTTAEYCPFIDRVAVAVYDPKTRVMRTYLSSDRGESPLQHYEAPLTDAPSLKDTLTLGQARVVNDLSLFSKGSHEHTQLIEQSGFASSCTFPLYLQRRPIGCVFFNSYTKGCFQPQSVRLLSLFSHLIAGVVGVELSSVRTMLAALKTASDMVHYRDPETGNHLERMSRFSRLIARHLSRQGTYPLDDEFIEHLFVFSPLHDVGKIAIPDDVLLKPARLDPGEWEVMKSHALKGRTMLDDILINFGLETLYHVDILRHIAEHHHEALDGSGYPHGLRGEAIPLEARVVAVADVFDALTSQRPYKPAWSNQEAFIHLRELSRDKLDRDCVEALIANQDQVEQIQQRFGEKPESANPR